MPSKYIHKKKKLPALIEGEVWVDVVGYEGLYMVSSMGRIRLINGQICLGSGKKGEYKRIVLHSKDGKKSYKRVHQLVAEAFIPNTQNKPEVNHKYGDKHDNRASSLEWVTGIENNNHAVEMGLRSIYRKYSNEIVSKIRSSEGLSNSELSRIYGIDYRYVWSMRKGLVRNKTN